MALKITSDNIASATLSTLGGGVKITTVAYPGSITAANPAGGETITVTGSGFNSGIIVYINNTIPCDTTYINSTSLTFVAPATGVGTYNIVLYNTDGSSGVKPIGIIFSSLPTWVTASGALLGVAINTSYSQSVSATGDGTITYSITSGSLPTGLSLNSSTGAITGTAPNTTGTSTFTITASDSQNQTASRSFSILVAAATPTVEYLVVAGGGGGASPYGGGAGAGGFRSSVIGSTSGGGAAAESVLSVSAGIQYTVTVGAGGTSQNATYAPGNNGSNSVLSTITSLGGGGSGWRYSSGQGSNGSSGGSGGGAPDNYWGASFTGGAGTTGQGYAGGGGRPPTNVEYLASGGGGAGAVGVHAFSGGTGGAGQTNSISGSAVTYAGGGGGGGNVGTNGGAGGTGGGGRGAGGGLASVNGTPNTGGGGGGGGDGSQVISGAGGSGVVIIRYADSYPLATSTTGSPTITNPTGYRVYTFTASGSITF